MAAKKNKERQQIIALAVVLAVIFLTLGYLYRDKLLPNPPAVESAGLMPRLPLPTKLPEDLYKREDFSSLKVFGDVPVRALPGGQSNPFELNVNSR